MNVKIDIQCQYKMKSISKLKTDIEIIGLDLSLTGTGWCMSSPDIKSLEYGEIKTKPDSFNTRRERVEYITKELICQIIKLPCKQLIIFIEGYSFSKQTSSLTQLGELGGVIRQMVYSKTGLDAIEIPPGSLKKFICGKGNAHKEDMKLAVFKKYGMDFQNKSNDSCDAFALAVFGIALLRLSNNSKLTIPEGEALSSTYKYSKYSIDRVKEILSLKD